MKAVILAGGKGARLRPYTTILPKPLMPIGDMPILEILLRQMKRAGIDEAVLTVGHLAELLRLFFRDGERLGLRITYSYEDAPLGTAGPLSLVEGLSQTFLVANGDVLTTLPLANLLAHHRLSGAAATIAMHRRQVHIDLGVIQQNDKGHVTGYIEKPTYDFMVSMGIYVFEPRVLSFIPRNEYLDFPDLVQRLIDAGEVVSGFPFEGYWQDLGRPDDYERAIEDFDRMRAEFLPPEAPLIYSPNGATRARAAAR
ncbi:putative Nucleotidyl transferase [Candidatus Promineifilum breve]|uniref:Nucleotidyl transferase n=1 Tax=Candidatus Promineifilum breve TaxID=1806508 RepID=A0A160T3C7_9CHLR|nr:sugar phosphate nucleotidyltransferase [Candidatus Promineifilum breve]CUS04192.2 putative Nucleotidyl transferase [Candidatus Promineifilum breve]